MRVGLDEQHTNMGRMQNQFDALQKRDRANFKKISEAQKAQFDTVYELCAQKDRDIEQLQGNCKMLEEKLNLYQNAQGILDIAQSGNNK